MRVIQANKPKFVPYIQDVLMDAVGGDFLLQVPQLLWVLFLDDEEFVGVGYAQVISDVRVYTNILMRPQNEGHRERKQAGKGFLEYVQHATGARKLEVTVPTEDGTKVRLFSQLGFKREGVCKASIWSEDGEELVDQYYMGLVVE